MGDVKGDLVPKYKLTKEQVDFAKNVNKLLKMQQLVRARTLAISYEGKKMTDLMLELNKRLRMLKPPQEQTKELPGMDFGGPAPSEEQMTINY